MAANTWPATLPQKPASGGYSEAAKDNTVRTEMEVGPAKMRRRSTSSPRTFKTTFELTQAQTETLDTFFHTTLVDGSLAFNWVNPRTDDSAEFRFVSPPQYSHGGGDLWNAGIELEQLP